MAGFPTPFSGGHDDAAFDDHGSFVPEHLPDPGEFLAGQKILVGDDHAAVHETARDLFDDRGVYDMTFGYNLARLNLDTRHPEAGFRYAKEVAEQRSTGSRTASDGVDSSVLRAEFTPTTAFCPQTHTLTVGAFRAWNGLDDRHEYELVRIRAAPMHQESEAVNEQLRTLEETYRETGELPDEHGTSPADVPDAPF